MASLREANSIYPVPPPLESWTEMITSVGMTWEAWFQVQAPPSTGQSVLLGTAGSNWDSKFWSDNHRRRFGAVWINTAGDLSVSTNVGTSSGLIDGPNVIDGRWHHVAVVWNATPGGGAQIMSQFKVYNLDYEMLLIYQTTLNDILSRYKQVIALETRAALDDIFVYLGNSPRRIRDQAITQVNFTVNVAVETANLTTARMLTSKTLQQRIMNATLQTTGIADAVTGTMTPVTKNLRVFDWIDPSIGLVGGATLFVDGKPYKGRLTYSPGSENIGQNGQFVIGGGYASISVPCQVSRARLWGVALTEDQITQVQSCKMPDAQLMFGGDVPFSLYASWSLSGNTTNDVSDSLDALSLVQAGNFVRGGACNYDTCPANSPDDGCPLSRGIDFWTVDECEAFASYSFCKRFGSARGRPASRMLTGCHA